MRPKNPRAVLGWLPAAIFGVVVAWMRFGPIVAVLAVAGGLGMAYYAQRRARRRLERDAADGGIDGRAAPRDSERQR